MQAQVDPAARFTLSRAVRVCRVSPVSRPGRCDAGAIRSLTRHGVRRRCWVVSAHERHPPEPCAHLRVDRRDDGVAVLTLDNPDQRNAMSDEMTASWVAAVDALAGDRDVRAVVVTGEGSAFCSGGNTGWIASEPDASVDRLRTRMIAFYRAWLSIRRLEVPTIAAVNGPAIGAGLCLALACDLRYAAAGAPGSGCRSSSSGCTPGWPRRTCCPTSSGAAHARDLLLTGRTVDADEALRLGLVSAVLPADGFLDGGAGDRGRDRRDRADRQPADHGRAARRRARRLRLRAAVGGAGPAGDAGDRGPAGGHPRRPGEASTRPVQRPVTLTGATHGPGRAQRRGPLPRRCVACLPLANATPTRPRASSAPNLGRPRDRVNAQFSTPVDNPVDGMWSAPPVLWTDRCGAVDEPVGDTPGPGTPSPALTSDDGRAHAVDGRLCTTARPSAPAIIDDRPEDESRVTP